MSAPTDRPSDPNSASFYAPKGTRAVRLGQVAEAAAALVPERFRDGEERGVFEGDAAMLRLRARVSLDPDVLPAPPMLPNDRSWSSAIVRLTLVVVAAAVIALFAIGQFPFSDVAHKQASASKMELASTSARPAVTVTPKRTEPMVPQLIVQNLRGHQGEPAPLGVRLHGQADGAMVMVIGLVSGMTLSAGSAVGANAWQIPVSDLVDAWLIPAADFVGAADLVAELRLADNTIAHRRPIHLEWIASQPAAPAPPVAPASPAVAAPRQLDRDAIAVLVERGKKFIAAGDLAAARVVLQRAAEANDAEAALALAATYDPLVLRELKVYGFAANIETARAWYEKAREHGSPDAPRRLELLASAAR